MNEINNNCEDTDKDRQQSEHSPLKDRNSPRLENSIFYIITFV